MTLIDFIFLTLLGISFIGLGVILFRKIPVLVNLSEVADPGKGSLRVKIRKGMTKLPGAERFNYELYLQKILSRVRVLTLKTENKTGNWLEKLRQKANQKNHNNDSYWEELKKAKEGK